MCDGGVRHRWTVLAPQCVLNPWLPAGGGDQISECDRKGPGGPVCNCCSGVCVHDGCIGAKVQGWMDHSGQVTNLQFPFSGSEHVFLLSWPWCLISFLVSMQHFIRQGYRKCTVRLSDCWITILLPVQSFIQHTSSKHPQETYKHYISQCRWDIFLSVLLATLKCRLVLQRLHRFPSCFLWFLLQQTQAKKQIKPNLAAPLIFNLPNVHIVTQYNSFNTLWELLPKDKEGVKALNTARVIF